jgi:hypothetical protein
MSTKNCRVGGEGAGNAEMGQVKSKVRSLILDSVEKKRRLKVRRETHPNKK